MFGACMIVATYVLVVLISIFLLANLTSPSRYSSSPGIIKLSSIGVKENIPLMKWEIIFDLMFPSNTRFHASTPSLSGDSFIPPLDVDVCTCIIFLAVGCQKKYYV
jgi:hypothetical protein